VGLFEAEHPACRQKFQEAHDKIRVLLNNFRDTAEKEQEKLIVSTSVSINNTAKEGVISIDELEEIIDNELSKAIEDELSNHRLSGPNIVNYFNLSKNIFNQQSSSKNLVKFKKNAYQSAILIMISRNMLDEINYRDDSGTIFKNNETPIWGTEEAKYSTINKRVEYFGRSRGISVKIAKGLYYRQGVSRGERVETEYLTKPMSGSLVVTDCNLYFNSDFESINIQLGKISNIRLFDGALCIFEDRSKSKIQIIELEDAEFLANIIIRVRSGPQKMEDDVKNVSLGDNAKSDPMGYISSPRDLWSFVRTGDRVLARKSARNGWREAIVQKVSDHLVYVVWKEYPEEGVKRKKLHEIALLTGPIFDENDGAGENTEQLRERMWNALSKGDIVIADERDGLGWWEARVLNVVGPSSVHLEWRDYPDQAAVTRDRVEIAFLFAAQE
jgi:hypothetical protein